MTVQMVEADNRESARAIQSAADQAESVKPGERLAGVAEALPGSRSAGAARSTGTEWDGDIRTWARSAEAQHDALDRASRGLTEADVLAATGLGGHPGPS